MNKKIFHQNVNPLTYFQILLMHWIIFIPGDASEPVPLLGSGIGFIVAIVWIPGENTHTEKNI